MSTVAPEQTGFELDRFQWAGDDRLEVEGRWFGVRGRRFVRPVLTVKVAGGRKRLLALLEHKPWAAEDGTAWIAAFPWDGSHDDVGDAELEVGALTVDLPPPGGARRARKRRKAESTPPLTNLAERTPASRPKVVAPPEPPSEPVLRAAGESRQQLERDVASARAELGRLRTRHDEELRAARDEARMAIERVSALETRAGESEQRAELLEDEARRLRDELNHVRESQGDQLTRMGASEAEARAELARERERAAAAGGEAARLREVAGVSEQLKDEREDAVRRLAEMREAHEEALAEMAKLRQAARRSAAEAERLRAASRRPSARLAADPQATQPFQAVSEGEEPKPRPLPSKPGPAVRVIPREKPAPPPPEDAAPPEREPEPEVPTAAEAEAPIAPPVAEPTRPTTKLPVHQAPSTRPPPGSGATRLLGEDAIVPLEQRGTLEVWGPRVVAVVLVALLLIALALIVRGLA